MTWSTLHRLYLGVSTLAGPLAQPILNKRLARGKEDPERLPERLGHATRERPMGPLIWMHGASVGEATSMLPLVHALLVARPDAHVMVTTGTVTSARRLATLLPDRSFHQFVPVDTRPAVQTFLNHWKPDLAIWVESELWPRLVTDAAKLGTPMALINARFSAKSLKGWRYAPEMLRVLLGKFGLIRTQDPETSVRLRQFRIASRFGGNLKALIDPPACADANLQAAQAIVADRPVWLAASTHHADEHHVIAAQQRLSETETAPLLVLAPRHPERRAEIEQGIADAGLTCAVHSRGEVPARDTQVWLADTMGEMGLWYRLAPVTFVGGSFGTPGGHTPFEPILLDSAIVHGPNVANFAPSYAAITATGGAMRVETAAQISDAVLNLLTDERAFGRTIQAARAAHAELMPDLDQLVEELLLLLREAS